MAYFPTGVGAAALALKKKPAPPGINTIAPSNPATALGVPQSPVVPNMGAATNFGPVPSFSNPYAGLIGGMPDLSALEAQYKAQSTEDAAARDAALRRLVISYGSLPDFANLGISDKAKNFLGSAINDQVRQLAANAEKEGVSVHARQAQANNIANRQIPALLAGRGLLRSGQTGYDLSQQAQAYKNQQYDTLNELLGNVEGTVGSYLQAERERQLALAQARMQAAWAAQQAWGDYAIQDPYAASAGGPTARVMPGVSNLSFVPQATRTQSGVKANTKQKNNPYANRITSRGGSF